MSTNHLSTAMTSTATLIKPAKILVTGTAGFIGFHLANALLKAGHHVVGVDNYNDYYSTALKEARGKLLQANEGFTELRFDLADRIKTAALFASHTFDYVVHLAAQPGVRYSLENPAAYIDGNLVAFGNVLEGVRQTKPKHFVFASSSSVYGNNKKTPFHEADSVDHPVSLYAATKRANELMAHSYAHLFAIPTTGLRFFTVYGPWGRPDMALFKFTRAIVAGETIDVFNHGELVRDYTYVDDIVKGIVGALVNPPSGELSRSEKLSPATSHAGYRIFNIGNHQPVKLLDFIAAIENAVGKPAIKRFLPMQPGDVYQTMADVSALAALTGKQPNTSIVVGVKRFVDWYREYYRV
jgi:UDP-glucuronate 4-epimerase